MLALNKGVPELINLKKSIKLFIEFRQDVILKELNSILKKLEKKRISCWVYRLLLENIDKVIEIIRSSSDTNDARKN